MELEREYKGRVLLLPAFTYLVESQKRKRSFARMDKSFEKGFKHIAYVTSDFSWKEDMQELQEIYFGFLH